MCFCYENKEKYPIYISKKYCEEKQVDLLLIGEEGNRHYVLIKYFNTFMYDHSLHRGRKHFYRYYLHAFITEETLKRHIKDCIKINSKQRTIMPKKSEYVTLKNYERKIKSPFIIYADFESILVPENNGKQNSEDSYTNDYQKYIAFSYGYKLVCVDDKFSKSFKKISNFIHSMIKESKYWSDVMEKYFDKKLVMAKEDNENFKNSTKCWICHNCYIDNDVKVRDHCHITGKCIGPADRDCNINLELNHKILFVFHSLKTYGSHQELGKFNLKISVISNGLGKYICVLLSIII